MPNSNLVMTEADMPRLVGPRGGAIQASFVICTKDRLESLRRCIASLVRQLSGDHEILVIDNSSSGSARMIAEASGARWVQETRPGSAWARNRGYQSAKYDIVAYIDDDCEADVVWARELLHPFVDPDVGIVTGSVLASRPDLAIPRLIDAEYSFHRGWIAARYAGTTGTKWSPFDIWRVGVGGTMAWRKSLLTEIGGFDEALGAGTPAGSCEDIDALRRALSSGAIIYYEPAALVWHEHPAYIEDLRDMLLRYAITLGAHAAKMVSEEKMWKGLFYLFSDWCWQIAWGLRLIRTHNTASEVRMPATALLLQPLASIVGVFRFFRYRRALRDGKPLTTTRATKRLARSLPPLRSGVVDDQVEITDPIADQPVKHRTRLLLRIERRPVFAMELPAGSRIREALEQRLPEPLHFQVIAARPDLRISSHSSRSPSERIVQFHE